MPEAARLHAIITGRVQGVGFRFFVIRNAKQLGLAGWVRNRTDGAVEIIAEGDKQDLQRLVSKLKIGPPTAWIEDISMQWRAPEDNFVDFVTEPTTYS